LPAHVKPIASWSTAFEAPDDHADVIRTERGAIQLVNGARQLWLDRFDGDAKRLELALTEIAGLVNAGSRKPLKVDVERHLARIAAERHDRAANYARAAERNNPAPRPSRPGRKSFAEALAAMED
jgi:hypothetical protein